MIELAFLVPIEAFFSLNPSDAARDISEGLIGFLALLSLAFCFAFCFEWIVLTIGVAMFRDILIRLFTSALLATGLFGESRRNRLPQPTYTPPLRPDHSLVHPSHPLQSSQSYGEGYYPLPEHSLVSRERDTGYQQYLLTSSPLYEQSQSQCLQQEVSPQQEAQSKRETYVRRESTEMNI